jgi:mannose-6-phosphate isomerase-like protein (cupin superfamily)
MATIIKDVKDFTAERAWGARFLAGIEDATVRLHWTDKPYRWHVNDGEEVFVVLDGVVEMLYRETAEEKTATLNPTDIFVADVGDAHVAHPVGEARILVVERRKSAHPS